MRPDPFLEFCLGWIDRNPVDTQGREAPDRVGLRAVPPRRTVTSPPILDLELGHLGDPMMDLAAFRMRDTVLGFGDMNVLYDQYAKHSGAPVDLAGDHAPPLRVHARRTSWCSTPRSPRRRAATDYMTNMQWASETNLFAIEALAEILGVDELDTVEVPEPRDSPVAAAHEHLVRSLRSLDLADEYERHQLRIAFRLARHLQRFDEIGDACTEADLDDLQAFLGRRPATWQEGDAALEEFVLADGGAHDEELLQLFHRRYLRYKMLVRSGGLGHGDATSPSRSSAPDGSRRSCRVLTWSTPRS